MGIIYWTRDQSCVLSHTSVIIQNELAFFINDLESEVEPKFIHYVANAKVREELLYKHWRMELKLVFVKWVWSKIQV